MYNSVENVEYICITCLLLQLVIDIYKYRVEGNKFVISCNYTRNEMIHKSLGATVMAGSEQEKNSV